LESAEYLVLVLSPGAVTSRWVEQEWKAKYWQEVESGKTRLLPVLLQDCAVPTFLQDRKYADFRSNYALGLAHLAKALVRFSENTTTDLPLIAPARSPGISELLARVQLRSSPVSECIARALSITIDVRDAEFEKFCRHELGGWPSDATTDPAMVGHRQLRVILSPFGEINPEYGGWDDEYANAWTEMEREKERFFPRNLILAWPVSAVESAARDIKRKGLIRFQLPKGSLLNECKDPETMVVAYARSNAYDVVLDNVRQQLTTRLLRQLPSSVLE
jgi:hypothetical protein